jgi:hypothetical protein
LVDTDKWQDGYLDQNSDDFTEILFWLGQDVASGAPPAPPPALNGSAARTVIATGHAPTSPRRPRKGSTRGTRGATRKKARKRATATRPRSSKRTKNVSRKKAKKRTR